MLVNWSMWSLTVWLCHCSNGILCVPFFTAGIIKTCVTLTECWEIVLSIFVVL